MSFNKCIANTIRLNTFNIRIACQQVSNSAIKSRDQLSRMTRERSRVISQRMRSAVKVSTNVFLIVFIELDIPRIPVRVEFHEESCKAW